jgi:hypothetical protein
MTMHNFKLRGRKPLSVSIPIRHTTSTSNIPSWLLLFMTTFALILGVFTGCNLMTSSVYASCAEKGEWTWSSFLLKPAQPIKCSVDSTMYKKPSE